MTRIIEPAEARAKKAEGMVVFLSGELTAEIAARRQAESRVEDLERQVVMWKARAERVEHPIVLARAQRPSVRPVEISSEKAVAAVVPASDGFAARPVGSLLKSAGKPKGRKS